MSKRQPIKKKNFFYLLPLLTYCALCQCKTISDSSSSSGKYGGATLQEPSATCCRQFYPNYLTLNDSLEGRFFSLEGRFFSLGEQGGSTFGRKSPALALKHKIFSYIHSHASFKLTIWTRGDWCPN